MDSGQRGKVPNAKDWAEEINRATDAALRADLTAAQAGPVVSGEFAGNAEMMAGSGMTNAQAQALGRGAIFGRGEAGALMNGGAETPEEVAFERIDNTGEASVEAAVELSEIENNVVNPGASVGIISGAEEEEFEKRDEEMAENEANPKRSWIAGIEFRKQEAVAKAVEPGVNAFLHEKNPKLSVLLGIYQEGREETLGLVGHPIGKDNS